MNKFHIEPLERRTLLSTNSLTASASIDYEPDFETPAVALSWTRAATTHINGFDILRSNDGGSTYESIGTSTTNSFTEEDGFLQEGSRYFYKVCPFTNKGGDQAPIGTESVITPLGEPYVTIDAGPDGSVDAMISSETYETQFFTMRWWPADNPSHVSSEILNQLQTQGDAIYDITFTDVSVDGLNPAKQYVFTVTQSDDLTTSTAVTNALYPLGPPDNLQTKLLNANIVLATWQDDTTVATGFTLFWDRWNGDVDVPAGSMTVGKNDRSATVTGLKPHIDYDFYVEALDGKATSDTAPVADAEIDPPLDITFNGWGEDFDTSPILTPFANHSQSTASATAVQPDGKLIVVGTVRHNFVAARYTATGSLDTTFGTDGRVTIDFGGNDSATGVAVLPDGDILVTGTSNNSFAMAELKPDGTLNHAFGHHGRIGYSDGESLNASTLALAPNGNGFFISGIATTGSHHSAIIQQFQPNGTPNPVWDSTAARIPNVTGAQSAMALQSTQKIILACQLGNAIVVTRFNRDGSVDATFGAGGEQLIHFGKSAQDVYGIAIDPRNNSIILSGSAGTGASSTFAIARLTANGKLDTTFNTTGIAQCFVKDARATSRAVTVLPNGNIIAVGTANGNFALAEFTPSGQLDKHFNTDGLATTDQGSPTDIATALANPNNGSLYLAGTSGPDFSIARYFIDSPTTT